MNFSDFYIGQKASITKTFTSDEVTFFSGMTMDPNPIHLDADYAAASRFGKPIVQGPFVAAMIGGLLGCELPGPGTIYMQQTTRFMKPVFVGDTIRAHVMVTNLRPEKQIVTLRTWVEKGDNSLALDGEAVVLFLKAAIDS